MPTWIPGLKWTISMEAFLKLCIRHSRLHTLEAGLLVLDLSLRKWAHGTLFPSLPISLWQLVWNTGWFLPGFFELLITIDDTWWYMQTWMINHSDKHSSILNEDWTIWSPIPLGNQSQVVGKVTFQTGLEVQKTHCIQVGQGDPYVMMALLQKKSVPHNWTGFHPLP